MGGAITFNWSIWSECHMGPGLCTKGLTQGTGLSVCFLVQPLCRVHEIRQICRTFGNVQRTSVVKFNQMSSEKLEMSGKAQKNFAYSALWCGLWPPCRYSAVSGIKKCKFGKKTEKSVGFRASSSVRTMHMHNRAQGSGEPPRLLWSPGAMPLVGARGQSPRKLLGFLKN